MLHCKLAYIVAFTQWFLLTYDLLSGYVLQMNLLINILGTADHHYKSHSSFREGINVKIQNEICHLKK